MQFNFTFLGIFVDLIVLKISTIKPIKWRASGPNCLGLWNWNLENRFFQIGGWRGTELQNVTDSADISVCKKVAKPGKIG